MIPADQIKAQAAIECLNRLYDAIPKGKRRTLLYEISMVELAMKHAFAILDLLRGYFLEHAAGEASTFVKKIDELLPRAKEAQ